jgi:opacity protein-like surface antigen
VGSISTGFQLSEHVGMGISYGYVRKEAQDSSQSYSQNSVTISLGYRF